MKDVAIVIPSSNMLSYLKGLLGSLHASGVLKVVDEVLVVDDGSTDGTAEYVEELRKAEPWSKVLSCLKLDPGLGRFLARQRGAEAVSSRGVLFLDARVEFLGQTALNLKNLTSNFQVIQGTVEIPKNESIYSLYWDVSHRFIFREHFTSQENGFWLTSENFEKYTAGTGVFFCRRELFSTSCREFLTPPKSDDRALIKVICSKTPIWVTRDLEVVWRPRQTLIAFLRRIWERGPTFVGYHFYGPGTRFKLFIYLGLLGVLGNFLLFLCRSSWLPETLAIEALGILASILVFTRTPSTIVKLSGLHFVVVLTFGISILKSLITESPWIQGEAYE